VTVLVRFGGAGQMSGGQSSRLHLRRRRGRLERWYLVKEDRSAVVFTLDHIVTTHTTMGWTESLLYRPDWVAERCESRVL